MDKENSIITDEEYRVICAVFDKLGLDLTSKADVVSDLYSHSFVPLFGYIPEIAAILGAHAVKHPNKKKHYRKFYKPVIHSMQNTWLRHRQYESICRYRYFLV